MSVKWTIWRRRNESGKTETEECINTLGHIYTPTHKLEYLLLCPLLSSPPKKADVKRKNMWKASRNGKTISSFYHYSLF